MRVKRARGWTFWAALAVWALFTWPLPRYTGVAVPSSSQNVEQPAIRAMMPGDPLQLLYHYWLFADMLGGGTPWFHNLYEFNLGENHDAATRSPDAMYLPFSLMYAAGQAVGGRAFGYNFALFLALWGALAFTALLVRRYTRDPVAVAIAVTAAMVLPYRWVNLLGGSPAGFGMMWIPLFLYGLDVAVRDERPAGGWLAGLALVFMSWSDTHGLFFLLLSSPFWGVLALAAKTGFKGRDPAAWLRLLRAAWPIAALGLLAIGYNQYWHRQIDTSEAAGGRAFSEVALFSPLPQGFLGWRLSGKDSHIYVGLPLLALLLAGAGAVAGAAVRRPKDANLRRRLAVFALLALAAAGVAMLALGTNGPLEGRLLAAVRKLIPPYTMVRQPAKIFHLVPPLIALLLAVGLDALLAPLAARRTGVRVAAGLALAGLLAADARVQVRPTLTRLAERQRAYEAVAREAVQARRFPRALVLPLWPGDSDTGSVYEFYASLYRVRMLNGYRPVVPSAYRRDIFDHFESLNQGALSDAQADALLARGVHALLFHEDLYPEKVAPFPAGVALERLRRHPRLRFLQQDGAVWAFELLPAERARPPAAASHPDPARHAPPAWHWEAGREALSTNAVAVAPPAPGDAAFARLPAPGDTVTLRRAIRPVEPAGGGLRWWVRTRGGAVRIECLGENDVRVAAADRPAAPAWTWSALPFTAPADGGPVTLRVTALEPGAEVERLYLAAADPPRPAPGDIFEFPAALFFRAGYTHAERGSVVLRRNWESDFPVFYGPKWPLPPGRYETELVFETTAPAGTEVGAFTVPWRDTGPADWTPLAAGHPARRTWTQADDLPVSLMVRFARVANVEIVKVRFRRLE